MNRIASRAVRLVIGGLLVLMTWGFSHAASPPQEEEKATRATRELSPDPDRIEVGQEPEPGKAKWEQRRDFRLLKQGWPFEGMSPGAMRRAREHKSHMTVGDCSPDSEASSQQSVPGDTWVGIGPAPIANAQATNSVSGRVRAVVIDPSDPSGNTIYIGGAQGGVWKTLNGGASWKPMSDHIASIAISSLVLDPADSKIVYAGTGEIGGGIYGAGVFRSADRGKTWVQLGASVFDDDPGRGAYIGKVALGSSSVTNPLTDRTLHVASNRGIYRSTDGGQSWQKVLDCQGTDIVVDPADPAVIYAACNSVGIYKSSSYGAKNSWTKVQDASSPRVLPTSGFRRINLAIVSNPGLTSTTLFASMEDTFYRELKGLWKSSNGGVNWTQVTGHPIAYADNSFAASTDVSESENNDSTSSADVIHLGQSIGGTISSTSDVDYFVFQPTGNVGNFEIIASRAASGLNPKLSLLDKNGITIKSSDGLQLSGDERITMGWAELTPGENHYLKVESSGGASSGAYQLSTLSTDLWCQCEYDQAIAVKPDDHAVIYLGQIRLYRTMNGGSSWSQVQHNGGASSSEWIHQDIHAIAFDPNNSGTIVVGSDGGVWRSTDFGNTWSDLNSNLSLTQPFAGISQHPTDPSFLLLGSQDNGAAKRGAGTWTSIATGDGGATAIVSSQEYYYSTNNLTLIKTTDGGATAKSSATGWFQGLDTKLAPLVAPFVLDPNDANNLIAGSGRKESGKARRYVYYSSNRGKTWSVKSQHLVSTILALAIAKGDSSTWYAGLQNGKLYKTVDKGVTDWSELSWAARPNSPVSDIEVDPSHGNTVYVTYPGFGHPHVFRSTDGGQNFNEIGGWPVTTNDDLPDIPVHTIAVDPNHSDTLFVGTDLGIFRTVDGGTTWTTFDHGLPNVMVTDLIISTTTGPSGAMRAATYGRGIWELAVGNDDCDDAVAIGDGSVSGTTVSAHPDGQASCGSSNASPDVWYSYTATCDGVLDIDSCGSNFDTVLSLHDPGCPASSSTQRECNDDCSSGTCGARGSCLSEAVTIGDQRLIRLSGFNGDSGAYTLNTSCSVANDDCDESIAVAAGSNTAGSTRSAATDAAAQCDGIAPDSPGVWYTVTGTGSLLTASLCNAQTSYDSQLSIYCSGCGGQTCIGASNDACGDGQSEVTWCSSPGTTYHILVHGKSGATGLFQLDVSQGAACTLSVNCAPANDRCEDALIGGASPGYDLGDNTDADSDSTALCAPSSRDVWYEYTPICQGWSRIDTFPSAGTLEDTVLSVLDECGGREVACNDDAPDGNGRSRVTIPVLADEPLSIRVASYDGSMGTFPLDFDLTLAELVVSAPGFYLSDGSGALEDHLLKVDLVDRSTTDVGALGEAGIVAMAYAPNLGTMYASNDKIDSDEMATIDLETGAALVFGNVGYPSVRGLAWDPNTLSLYGSDIARDELIAIDPFTGEGTTIGSLGFGEVEGLAFDPATNTLYGADDASNQLITIDTATGAGTAVGGFGPGMDQILGLTFDTQNRLLYGSRHDVAGHDQIVLIDTGTGAANVVGPNYSDLSADSIEFVAGLPPAIAGREYEAQIGVGGGCPEYGFGDFSGLPAGLVGSEEGRVSGAAEELGTYVVDFTVGDTNLGSPEISAQLPLRVRPGNDNCSDSFPIEDGYHSFETTNALTDGPEEPSCSSGGSYSQVGADIWYCYQATCTGEIELDLCDSSYDTKVAVYDGCGCPGHDSAIACNDDSCEWRSWMRVPVVAGDSYAIRIGGFREARGLGAINLICDGNPGGSCCEPSGCSLRSEGDCLSLGGSFNGAGSTCEPDSDGDSLADICDACPGDPAKTEPGFCGCGTTDYDSDGDGLFDCDDDDDDGDGVPDVEDAAPMDRFVCMDIDDDGCDDCSSGNGHDPANDGPDGDGDGFCDPGDCDPGFANTYPGAPETNDGVDNQCPGDEGFGLIDEITGIAGFFDPLDKAMFSWRPQSGASLYEVARSTHADFSVECVGIETPDPQWRDEDSPLPGGGFFYLVRSKAPHIGSWGADSAGIERNSVCP